MYRGYIAVKDKKAIEPFKDVDNLRTLDEVKDLEGYAGVLADDSILIDVDDADQAEILMDIVEDKQLDCNVYETTRGMHFVFKNNGVMKNRTGAKLAIGIDADIKIGTKNSYQVLKNNGEERFLIWDALDGKVQQLPKWLFPVDSNVDFLNLEEGDGRNQTLFSYILTLQKNEFTDDEARETLQVINDYVLSEPLDQSELETIYREDAFSDEVFFGGQNGTTFLFDKFARFLMNKHHIKRVNGELHIYDNGVYHSGMQRIEQAMIRHIPTLRAAQRKEVHSYLNILDVENVRPSDAELILFRNGVLDIQTGEMKENSPDYIITNKINYDYNPNAYSQLADDTLNKMACNDKDIRMLLEELIGATLYRSNHLAGGKAFILTGEKSNGKSTFLHVIRNLLGRENYSTLDLNKLGDRFMTAELAGKLANIGDDIDNEFIKDTGVFKKLVTGDELPAERKGQDPFQFESFSKLIFSANSIPRLGSGKDFGALMRRILIIPFNAKFDKSDGDYNPFIRRDLTKQDSIEYFIKIGIEGLIRVLGKNEFTHSDAVFKEIKAYEKESNPIISYLEEVEQSDFKIVDNLTTDVYKNYQEFCFRNGYKPLSNAPFGKEIGKQLNVESRVANVDGKSARIYKKITGTL